MENTMNTFEKATNIDPQTLANNAYDTVKTKPKPHFNDVTEIITKTQQDIQQKQDIPTKQNSFISKYKTIIIIIIGFIFVIYIMFIREPNEQNKYIIKNDV